MIKNIFKSLLLLLTIVAVSAWVILFTTEGLQIVFWLTNKFIPGNIVAAKIDGNLMHAIQIENFSYQNKQRVVNVSTINLQWQPKELLKNNLVINNLQINNLVVEQKDQKPLLIKSATLQLTAMNQDIDGNLAVDSQNPKLNLQLSAQGTRKQLPLNGKLKSPQGVMSIKGSVTDMKNISLQLNAKKVSVMQVVLENLHLNLIANKKNNGWNINGYANNMKMYLPQYGLVLNPINLKFNTVSTNNLHYQLAIVSGGGQLNVDGRTKLQQKGYPSEIQMSGTNFLAHNTPELKLYLSPQLKIITQKNQVNVNGTVVIPKANIAYDNFGGTTRLPEETVFVGEQKKPKEKSLLQLSANVHLQLGDNIHFSAARAKGRLAGAITITTSPHQPITATGQIRIVNGTYLLPGQDLKIARGNLNFSGGPISNPNLDIQAIKQIDNAGNEFSQRSIIVGINAQGTVNSPKTELFSEPTGLSNEDILSYLLFGYPSDKLSDHTTELLLKAGQSLNLGGGQTPILGTLLPQFLGSYGTGLMQALNILTLRYHLTDHIEIRTQGGLSGASADILYTIEH